MLQLHPYALIMNKLSSEQIIASLEELAEYAGSKKAQKSLGKRLFEAVARLSVSVAFEAVCLRKNKQTSQIEVFMLQRDLRDSYPGQWHIPGSVFRPGEQPKDVARRLATKEFRTEITSNFKSEGMVFYQEPRGWFLSLVYLVKCKRMPIKHGRWWSVNDLPKNIVPHHLNYVIPVAVKVFKKTSN